jgi:hypothetical protein
MEANEALMIRDAAEMSALYELFDISVSTEFNGVDTKPGITYCCRIGLCSYYRANVDKRPLANTVLVLDEVDQLIVDEKPNSNYVASDMERSPQLKSFFQSFQRGTDLVESRADRVAEFTALKAKAKGYYDKGLQLIASERQPGGPAYATKDDENGEKRYYELDEKARRDAAARSTAPTRACAHTQARAHTHPLMCAPCALRHCLFLTVDAP